MKNRRIRLFLPFDSIIGFKESIKEKEIIKTNRIVLLQDSLELLDHTLSSINIGDMITLTYYNKYHYETLTGLLSKINIDDNLLYIVKTAVLISDIIDIQIINKYKE